MGFLSSLLPRERNLPAFSSLLLGKLSRIVWLISEIVDIHFHSTISLDTPRQKTILRTSLTLYPIFHSRSSLSLQTFDFWRCFESAFIITFSTEYFHRGIFSMRGIKREERRGREKEKRKNDTLCNDKAATRRDYLRDEQVTETYSRGTRVLC